MAGERVEALIEALYDAVVEPEGWAEAMALLQRCFDSGGGALYFLDYGGKAMSPVQIAGIGDDFLRSFEALFYAEDNPSTKVSALHRPGVIRTDQQLVEHFRDPEVLRRSRYYAEWLRPQGFGHTMGTTPLAEEGRILNLSLLRAPARGPFKPEEMARFARIEPHLRRAVRMALRLETLPDGRELAAAALDRLRHGVVFLDTRGRVLYRNAAAEALLQGERGLLLRQGHMAARDPAVQQELLALLRGFAVRAESGKLEPPPRSLVVRGAQEQGPLIVSAVGLTARRSRFLAPRPLVALVIVDPAAQGAAAAVMLQVLYRLTPAESRLARALLARGSLREAAAAAGMTYETARWYLRILFQKTATGRQGELLARLTADLAAFPLDG